MTFIIVDDHSIMREAVAWKIRTIYSGAEVLESGNAEDACEMIAGRKDVKLAVVDIMLPGMTGFAFMTTMKRLSPNTRSVAVSAHSDENTVRRALRSGASWFVSKDRTSEDLMKAIAETLADKKLSFKKTVTPSPVSKPEIQFGVSPAQGRILELLGQGKNNKEIAAITRLTEGTVKLHLSSIYRALEVSSRADAIFKINRCRPSAD